VLARAHINNQYPIMFFYFIKYYITLQSPSIFHTIYLIIDFCTYVFYPAIRNVAKSKIQKPDCNYGSNHVRSVPVRPCFCYFVHCSWGRDRPVSYPRSPAEYLKGLNVPVFSSVSWDNVLKYKKNRYPEKIRTTQLTVHTILKSYR
jgi:hypothetical protein